jgi:uncharacterized phiE125 gp8 family phage protein
MYPPFGGVSYGPYGNLGIYGGLVSYGSLELTETSPPQSFVEPLSLPDVQSYLQLPDSMAQAQAATLLMFISAAREQAEILQNRDLVRKQWDIAFDYWPGWRIELRPHLVSVDLAQFTDATGTIHPMVANTDYVVDLAKKPGILAPPYGKTWPIFTPPPTGAILIRFTAGIAPGAAFWADAGARVKVGMKLLISMWFSNRIPLGTKVDEFPYAVTSCLSYGAVPRAK